MKTGISRRDLNKCISAALLFGAASARQALAAGAPLTAAQVVDRIKQRMAQQGVIWSYPGSDGFKIGNPDTPVTGVATTFQATHDVLQRAAAAKLNLIITHERMFWDYQDEVTTLQDDAPYLVPGSLAMDPVTIAKRKLCEDNNLVVWRFHDYHHQTLIPGVRDGKAQPVDPILGSFSEQLNWAKYYTTMPGGFVQRGYQIPAMKLKDVARHMREKLGTCDIRVIGDPDLMVQRIGVTAHLLRESLERLQDADVVLFSEVQEIDTFDYVRDAISLGLPSPKGIIAISHEAFEEQASAVLKTWLKPMASGLPVKHIPSGAPYWTLPPERS
ncbi:MAG: Nif3-like dinuclear metal center hexameric protein [Sphingobium sp.]|nr:Nif3-like dinuclear metal center hexameric protein [Sphingobium sp.]MCP5400073.1 Nif3-like dinuclear metal center hexameric protein [Sphingomonas sp.]